MDMAGAGVDYLALLGKRLRVTLANDDMFEGDVFAVQNEPSSGVETVVFRTEPHHNFKKADYRLVAKRFIKAHQASDYNRSV